MTEEMQHDQVRSEIVDGIKRRLVGPRGGPEEVLVGTRPSEAYIAGYLAPQEAGQEPSEAEELSSGGTDGSTEDGQVDRGVSAALSSSFKPASLGLTCIVDSDTDYVLCNVGLGRYREEEQEAERETDGGEDESDQGDEFYPIRCRRVPVDPEQFRIPLGKKQGEREFDDHGFLVAWRLRESTQDEGRLLTVVVVNTQKAGGDRVSRYEFDKHLFQVGLRLEGEGGSQPFLPKERDYLEGDCQARTMELYYRNRPAFASGHGCATLWDEEGTGRAGWVETAALPTYEMEQVVPTEHGGQVFNMNWLATAESDRVAAELRQFLDRYAEWVDEQRAGAETLDPGLKEVALDNVSKCEDALEGMREGVALLESDDTVMRCFQIMNLAIEQQIDIPDPDWYPFQLGFILGCLEGATAGDPSFDPVHVLWFPTGGGKTEAYLGLAAFTIAHRRLSGAEPADGAGVSVLMRYTLRLLTIQQFQRAAGVICALERLRRTSHPDLGEEEISIGLWIGSSSTPNYVSNAIEQLEGGGGGGSTPVQLYECPSCNHELGPADYTWTGDRSGIEIQCPQDSCSFNDGLPVYVVDEQIYRRCPTLVIGTVDKFARIPWNMKTRALFGIVQGRCSKHGFSVGDGCGASSADCRHEPVDPLSPPSLVIQDELHLISGPLGTMVGVYEALIDFVCRQRGRTPQIVASSATIRRAQAQCDNLYDRDIEIFPPRALSESDTYFSKSVSTDEEPGRLYMGLLPQGFSMKTAVVRLLSSILHDREELPDIPDLATPEGRDLRDPYWTTVGYFNSLRELGGAIRLLEDDVPGYMSTLVEGGDEHRHFERRELTSRRSGEEIPQILGDVERSLRDHDPDELVDVVFATNMISVGVDVPRLGSMIVAGQPKATSEYLQATSRVGRRYPGLVTTMYNWAKPRDRSHYEDFTDYHATIYRHVEANSVTPYTEPALQRGTHALLVGAVRMLEPGMGPNSAAGNFDEDLETVGRLREFLSDRLADPREARDPSSKIQRYLEVAVDDWSERVRNAEELYYKDYRGNKPTLLLSYEKKGARTSQGIPTLNSLREVEPETPAKLHGGRIYQ